MNSTFKYFLTAVAVFVIVGAGYTYYTTTDHYKAKELYSALEDDFTADDCDVIINLYPNTEYAQLALEKKNWLLQMNNSWSKVCKNPSVAGFNHFKENFSLSDKQQRIIDKKIDSVLWNVAVNELSEKAFQDYLAHNPNPNKKVLAEDIVQNIASLPSVDKIQSTLEKNIHEFLRGYGKSASGVYMPTLADTLDFFLFHRDLLKKDVDRYIRTKVNGSGRRFDYKILSDIEYAKSRMLIRGVGYSAEFLLQQKALHKNIAPVNYKAKLLFNAQGKILYFKLRRDYRKVK